MSADTKGTQVKTGDEKLNYKARIGRFGNIFLIEQVTLLFQPVILARREFFSDCCYFHETFSTNLTSNNSINWPVVRLKTFYVFHFVLIRSSHDQIFVFGSYDH